MYIVKTFISEPDERRKWKSRNLEFVAVLVFADFIASKAVFNAGEEACGAAWGMGFELLEALKKEQKADAVERAFTGITMAVVPLSGGAQAGWNRTVRSAMHERSTKKN